MNPSSAVLYDLLEVLSEEELLRVAYRLRKKGKEKSAALIDRQLEARATAKAKYL